MNGVTELFKRFRQTLTDYVRRQIGDMSDAEDILQDVFLCLTLQRDAAEIENEVAWLWRATRNRIIDYQRKRRISRLSDEKEDTQKAPEDAPEMKLLRKLMWQQLAEALAELPEEQREAFVETELKGKSNQQLSKETGVTIATLISRKYYAKQHLRQRLRNIYEELIMDKE
jgi:RNA polymerase sigma factor, sigma-70 family